MTFFKSRRDDVSIAKIDILIIQHLAKVIWTKAKYALLESCRDVVLAVKSDI
jgi:hypothetical protein